MTKENAFGELDALRRKARATILVLEALDPLTLAERISVLENLSAAIDAGLRALVEGEE